MPPQTRQSAAFSAMPDLRPAQTPQAKRSERLAKCIEGLRSQDGITLPYPVHDSPSKRRKSPGHDVVKRVSFLFFKDEERNTDFLSRALEQFRLRSPAFRDTDDRLNDLLEELTSTVDSVLQNTPQSIRRQDPAAPSSERNEQDHVHIASMGPPPIPFWSKPPSTPDSSSGRWPTPQFQSTQLQDEVELPNSPTLSIRHAPKPMLEDIATYPELPCPARPASSQTAIWRGEMPDPRATTTNAAAGTISANTSFTSVNTSIWSNPQGAQDPPSPATSVGSIPCMDGANDGGNGDCTQSTFYGTPITFNSSHPAGEHSTSVAARTDTSNYGSSDIFDSMADQETPSKHPPSNEQPPTTREQSPQIIRNRQSPSHASSVLRKPHEDSKQRTDKSTDNSTETSPSRPPGEHVRVKRIRTDGIAGGLKLSPGLLRLPFNLRFECARLLGAASITGQQLEDEWPEPRDFSTLRAVAKKLVPSFQSGSEARYEKCSYHVTLRYTESKKNDQPLFEPELVLPGPELSTCWQRAFGFDRMLFVDSESLLKPPMKLGLSKHKDNILQCFLDMLGEEQEFLGRTWLQFHVKTKDSKRGGLAGSKQHGAFAFIFVALKGDDNTLPPLTLHTLIDWALPIPENAHKSWCKMYARLDQRASRNTHVMFLDPDEIEDVDDKEATQDPPPTGRNDPQFAEKFLENSEYKEGVIMSDGCSEAPKYTLRLCGQALGQTCIPSAAQIRCAGAKGMIVMSRPTEEEDDNPHAAPPQTKIRLAESQRKVVPKSKDREATEYDKYFYELSANAVSRPVEHSFMYLDFLQILNICGVPTDDMEALVLRRTEEYKTQLLEAIEDPEACRSWLHAQGALMEERRRNDDIATIAGFPSLDIEKAILMLDSGFDPRRFAPLKCLIDSEIESSAERMIRGFKVPLQLSTMVFGEADLTGSLGPEQGYLRLSKPLYDPLTGKSITQFEGWTIVSRLPAARDSDMRSVEFVYRPELSHLVDTLVLSTKGPQPLADMCSGGDYDGDRFWACKEPALVKHFRNRPAPRELPDPASLGIKVDERTLGDIIEDHTSEEDVRRFVRMGTANRMKQSWVGIVTKLHARVAHAKGLDSEAAVACADLKDSLMDSDKSGFTFDQEALDAFVESWGVRNLPKPAYFEYTDKKDDNDDPGKQYQKADPNHVVDKIYCQILQVEISKALELAREEMKGAKDFDPDLTAFYDAMMVDARNNPAISSQLDHLKSKLRELNELYKNRTGHWSKVQGTRKSSTLWNNALIECAAFYDAIEPLFKDTDPTIREWCRKNGTALTTWERLKASALAKFYEIGKLRFGVAGGQLCKLKAEAVEHRIMTMAAYRNVKPRKRKRRDDDIVYTARDMDVDQADGDENTAAGAVQ